MLLATNTNTLTDGTVYSTRKTFCPFSTPPLEAYAPLLGEERVERLRRAADRLKGLKLLEINATAQGGGVAEMLYSSIPFLNMMGIEAEWKILNGNKEYFECTKNLHNILQGDKDIFSFEKQACYIHNIEDAINARIIDYSPNVICIHDPQPLGLRYYLNKPEETWVWRCHIDIEEDNLKADPDLWSFMSKLMEHYDAAIFSAARHVISAWQIQKFTVPPFIDPLSEKNKELSEEEVCRVLAKYDIDPKVPIIAQIGRFDPWKGIDRTIATYRRVKQTKKCQLVLAGGMAADDPEGDRILQKVISETKEDEDIHILNLSLANRLENNLEINALQRAASVIMQPSIKEGFGLVITEALWKGKPVIATNVGGIPLQIREGVTGFFYRNTYETSQQVTYLLEHPREAERIGQQGRRHVQEQFLLPDRVADYLMAINTTIYSGR